MRILIIEDERDLALPLKKTVEMQGYAVDYAEDGETGYRMAKIEQYDCILLDLNLPKMDGIELADKLRKLGKTMPIIMLTARSQIYNKLEGFKTGADDYVTKPFDLLELMARIKAVIRRNSLNHLEKLEFGNMELIPDQNLVVAKNKKIQISTKESGILEYLIRNTGRIVSAEELLEHVWDHEADMFSDTVKTHIKTLRQKIDPNKKLIETIRNKGYRIKI